MTVQTQFQTQMYDQELLQSLLHVGIGLSVEPDRHKMLDTILSEARKIASAEAGSLYVLQAGQLRFEAVQNDRLDNHQISKHIIDREIAISCESLAGYAAFTKQMINLKDSYVLPEGSPFSINREFEAATGYRVQSILAIPLACPDGHCIGVLELLNCLDAHGNVEPFPEPQETGLLSLASMAAVTIKNAQLQEQLKLAHMDTIMRLASAAEFRNQEATSHISRVSRTSNLIANAMGLPRRQVELIKWASPMHDIGKIGIPDAILLKEGPLTADQREVVENHTIMGAEILSAPHCEIHVVARQIALTHHERWDGSGYPNHIKGKEIPLEGQIVGLADIFDTLLSERCYKEAFSVNQAVAIIRNEESGRFDPDVFSAFFEILDDIIAPYAEETANAKKFEQE